MVESTLAWTWGRVRRYLWQRDPVQPARRAGLSSSLADAGPSDAGNIPGQSRSLPFHIVLAVAAGTTRGAVRCHEPASTRLLGAWHCGVWRLVLCRAASRHHTAHGLAFSLS